MMLHRSSERFTSGGTWRAADVRRTSPHGRISKVLSPPNLPIYGDRLDNASGRWATRIRSSEDAAFGQEGIVSGPLATNIVPEGSSEKSPQTSPKAADAAADDPVLLSEQLQSRRMSNGAASTSSQVASLDGDASSWPRIPQWPSASSRHAGTSATSPPALPGWPTAPGSRSSGPGGPAAPPGMSRPGGSSPGSAGGPPSSPQVPPEAAQLYARSSIARDLASTASSSEVLTPLFDFLQLEPPAPTSTGGASNAQRVYKSTPGDATGPNLTRKRVQVRVVDSSELLLARDEAVKTELLGRTWQDLLQFEERLGMRTGGGAHDAAAGAPDTVAIGSPEAASLEDVLAFLQQQVATAESQQPGPQVQEQEHPGQSVLGSVDLEPAQRSAEEQLTRLVRRTSDWQDLMQLYAERRADFSAGALAAMLMQLARALSQRGAVEASDTQVVWGLWNSVLEHLMLTAQDLTGPQAVVAVRALAQLPVPAPGSAGGKLGMTSKLRSARQILTFSKARVAPLSAAAVDAGAGPSTARRGAGILNTREVAVVKRRRGARGDPTALPPAGDDGGDPSSSSTSQQGATTLAARPTPYWSAASMWSVSSSMDELERPADPDAMKGHDYANLAYHLGQMNADARPHRVSVQLPPSVVGGLVRGALVHMDTLSALDLSRLIYGLSLLRVKPSPQWMYSFYVSTGRALGQMNAVQLTMLMYGACRMPHRAPPPWIEACLAVFRRRLDLDMDSGGLALIMHALGRMKYKPRDDWLAAHLQATSGALEQHSMSLGEMSQLFRGLSRLGVQPGMRVLAHLWEASGMLMERGQYKPAQLANLSWALANLKLLIPRRWYKELLAQAEKHHKDLRPYHKRRLLFALHAFGCRSKELMGWYKLMRIPLKEMPGYKALMAMKTAMLIRRAKAQLQAEQRPQEQGARPSQQRPQEQGQSPVGKGQGRKPRSKREGKAAQEASLSAAVELEEVGGQRRNAAQRDRGRNRGGRVTATSVVVESKLAGSEASEESAVSAPQLAAVVIA